MGAANVKSVYACWGHLKDRPLRLLAFMALTAKDKDEPPRYFGGWETLALSGLGRPVPEPTDEATRKHADAVRQDVKRTIQTLRTAGAITLLNTPKIGSRAVYVLNLDGPNPKSTGVQDVYPTQEVEGDTTCTSQGYSSSTPRGVQTSPKEGDTTCTPKEEVHQEDGSGLTPGDNSTTVTNLQDARARTRAALRSARG